MSSFSRRTALWFPMLAAALVTSACARNTSLTATAPRTTPAVVATTEAVAPAQSIFDLTSNWRSQDGITARLSTLNGGLLVVGLANTNCATACATTIAAMKTLERATDASIHLLLVTLDPVRDTPEALAAFAKAKGLSASRWTIVAGSAESTRELASVLDTRNRRFSAEQLANASMLSVIDPNGVLVQQEGYGNLSDTFEAIRLLTTIIH